MKKIALVIVLGLLLQSVPVCVLASGPPPPAPQQPTNIAAILLVGGLAVFGFNLFDAKPTAKINGNEFAALNDNPAFKHLLKQMAGGSLNTAEILKN